MNFSKDANSARSTNGDRTIQYGQQHAYDGQKLALREAAGALLVPGNGNSLRLSLEEYDYDLAYLRVQQSLTHLPHIRAAAQQEPRLIEVLIFHQFMAGEIKRKKNPDVRLAVHDLRITEAMLEFCWTYFHAYPSPGITAGSILHDIKEDHFAKGWVIRDRFGQMVDDFITALSIPRIIQKIKDKKIKSGRKHDFKMRGAKEQYTIGHCLVKHPDGLDCLLSDIRQLFMGKIIIDDIEEEIERPGQTTIEPRERYRVNLDHRYEFSLAMQDRLPEAEDDTCLNLTRSDRRDLAAYFRAQFAKVGSVYVAAFGITPPPGLQRDIDNLQDKDLWWAENVKRNMPRLWLFKNLSPA